MSQFTLVLIVLGTLALAPLASAHGALALNEFDTYAISDFEGHEDSFPWEGFEIWDIYVGDGYMESAASHGVYFKANLAGDGTLRPLGGESWEVTFTFAVGGQSFDRTVVHDGTAVSTDFEAMEWQIADGNVFQVHAWVPIPDWQGASITDLVVVSSVDGQPRDTAPGGFHDPVSGAEIPFSAPPTVVFPAMGEGRIVDSVPMTGAGKFLAVTMTDDGDGAFTFTVDNPLAEQGQHFMFHVADVAGWTLDGTPNAESLDGGASTTFQLRPIPDAEAASLEPLRIDLMTDIGGLRSYYAFVDDAGIHVVDDASLASTFGGDESVDAPGLPALGVLVALGLAGRLRSRRESP